MGLLSSLINGFTGKSANQAVDQARTDTTAGYNAAKPSIQAATQVYDPFLQTGEKANALYSDILTGGPGAQSAWDNFNNNPFFKGAAETGLTNLERKYNAAGKGISGGALEAASQYGLQQYADPYLTRLDNSGREGLTAAGGKANALGRQGDFEYGYGHDLASNDIEKGNAGNIFAQNVIGLAGTAANALGAASGLGWLPSLRKSSPAAGGAGTGRG